MLGLLMLMNHRQTEFPVGRRLMLILIHLNAHMHSCIQFRPGNIFCGKERVPSQMYGNSKDELIKETLFLKDNYTVSFTLQTGQNVLRCF